MQAGTGRARIAVPIPTTGSFDASVGRLHPESVAVRSLEPERWRSRPIKLSDPKIWAGESIVSESSLQRIATLPAEEGSYLAVACGVVRTARRGQPMLSLMSSVRHDAIRLSPVRHKPPGLSQTARSETRCKVAANGSGTLTEPDAASWSASAFYGGDLRRSHYFVHEVPEQQNDRKG